MSQPVVYMFGNQMNSEWITYFVLSIQSMLVIIHSLRSKHTFGFYIFIQKEKNPSLCTHILLNVLFNIQYYRHAATRDVLF